MFIAQNVLINNKYPLGSEFELKKQHCFAIQMPNGLRYLRWGGDSEAVQPEKGLWCRKLLGMCAESPASGAHFVGWTECL
jgi:hypothetical protein